MTWRRPTLDALLDLGSPVFRLIVQRSCRNLPQHYGIRLASTVPDNTNQDLIQRRVVAALQILADKAPTHLRWLQRGAIVILLATLHGGHWIQFALHAGILRLNPQLVWRSSEEDLALELIAVATLARFRRAGFEDSGRRQLRIVRRGILERLWLAERLALPDFQKEPWRQGLSRYPRHPADKT